MKQGKQKPTGKSKSIKRSNVLMIIGVVAVFVLIGFGVMITNQGANQSSSERLAFMHIHGLDFTANGTEIVVPAHDGLRVYKNGHWTIPAGEKNDYMGFSMTDDGFYSSGHPGADSSLANPIGIVKSADDGRTIEKLALYGESDFHGMTVGYHTKEIYVFNGQSNSKMSTPGFYYSVDDGKTWKNATFTGVSGAPMALAAHPTEKGTVAIATDEGVFISRDYGNNFKLVISNINVSTVSFSHDNALLVGVTGEKAKILRMDLQTMKQTELSVPALEKGDAIAYVKQNPVNKNEYAFATLAKDIYLTKDNGTNWTQLATKGTGIDAK